MLEIGIRRWWTRALDKGEWRKLLKEAKDYKSCSANDDDDDDYYYFRIALCFKRNISKMKYHVGQAAQSVLRMVGY
jgi:hypothetical protein